jgi:hypothetical protein
MLISPHVIATAPLKACSEGCCHINLVFKASSCSYTSGASRGPAECITCHVATVDTYRQTLAPSTVLVSTALFTKLPAVQVKKTCP